MSSGNTFRRNIGTVKLEKLSQKVAEAIGEQLLNYSDRQKGLFEQFMGRVMKRHKGHSDTITPMEKVGAHEMVTEHLLPLEIEDLRDKSQ